MKALVTGGAGLIGSHIVDELVSKGYDVRVFDNLEPETHRQGKPLWVPEGVEFILGSMQEKDKLHSALKGVDVVFHQAAFGGFAPEISKYVLSNTLGTAYLFDVIREKSLPIRKIVTASSQAVYGEGTYNCLEHGIQYPKARPSSRLEQGLWEVLCPSCDNALFPLPTHESKPVDPAFIYSLTKYDEEVMTLKLGETLNIPSVALRYAVTYGPRQSLSNPYTGIASIFSTRILNDLPPIIYEDGLQMRDFIFVKDVARANILVMESDKADYNVFNVSSGKGTSLLDFVKVLSKTYSKEVGAELPGKFRPGDVRHLFSDNSKLCSLGWNPKYSLEEGFKEYAEWILEQGSVAEYFSEAFEVMKQRGIVRDAKK